MRATLVIVALLMAIPVAADYSATARSDFARGQVAMASRDLETAMRHFDAAIEAEPGYWEAHKALGECFLRLNNPKEARKHLEEASRLSPSDPGVQETLRRAIDLEKAHAEDDALAERIRQQLRSKSSPPPGKTAKPPGPTPEAMRQKAASIFRPRMAAVAAAAKAYRRAARRYQEASCRYRPGAFEVGRYLSEADWSRRMRGDSVINDDDPACRAIAGEMRPLAPRIASALDGADAELASPPPVSRAVREEVFATLVQELW